VAPKSKRVDVLGISSRIPEQALRRLLFGSGAFLLAFNGLVLPFVLPKLRRFRGAPYLPMRPSAVDLLFGRVLPAWASRAARGGAAVGGPAAAALPEAPLRGLTLVDFGSGDGRIVTAAAANGMRAVGYELNPYLVWWSRLRNFRAPPAAPGGSAEIRWANAWAADLRSADVVTFYGRPGDRLMERAAAKCRAELPPHAAVVSYRFPVPGWERLLVQDVDGVKLYDFSRAQGATAGGAAGPGAPDSGHA